MRTYSKYCLFLSVNASTSPGVDELILLKRATLKVNALLDIRIYVLSERLWKWFK